MYQNNHSEMANVWLSSVYFWCESTQQKGMSHTDFGRVNAPSSLSCWIGRLCPDILENSTEKWPSSVWKQKCRKQDEELMTLEMLVFFSLAYLRVLNGLQKASAQHEPSGMQIPFPDVKLHINWLFTFFFLFLIKRSSMSMWRRG